MENHYKDGTWQYPEFAQPEDIFLEIIERIDSPDFGVQYDPSNAIVGGFDPVAFLDKVKHRVVSMHASDRYLAPGATLDDLKTRRRRRRLLGQADARRDRQGAERLRRHLPHPRRRRLQRLDLDRGRHERPRRDGPLGRLPARRSAPYTTASDRRGDRARCPRRADVPLFPESSMAIAAYAALALLFAAIAGSKLASQRWAHPLPSLDALPPDAAAAEARVSVIVPARDEADTIETSVRRLLAQRGAAIEVIVVSDRSVDATPAIVARLAGEDPRVRLVEVSTLPERWLGKTHALHLGSQAATGDWLLFTDADCLLRPDVIARALRVAARDGVEHVALTPAPITATVGGYAWHYVFLAGLADWFARANRDLPGGYVGFGAFNMVRASTHRAFGGHEPLRLTILDDVRLGLLVRRAGGRCRAFLGGEDVRCHWGTTLGQGIRLTEKNYFAAAHYRGGVVGFLVVVIVLLWVGVWPRWPRARCSGWWPAAPAGCSPCPPSSSRGGCTGRSPAHSWRRSSTLAAYAIVRSAVLTLRRGGVRWRDTFYPLAELRAGDLK